MTGQITDRYRYNGEEFSLVATTNPIGFEPEEYGFRPAAPHTACWRGYVCEYEITDERLYLSTLRVHHGDGDPYPVFGGVAPGEDRESIGSFMIYRGLKHPIDYTGGIAVGCGFLDDYYIHMGFQRSWAYEQVYELQFEQGRMVRKLDHSPIVAEIRRQMKEVPDFWEKTNGSIARYMEKTYPPAKGMKLWWI